MLLPNAHRFLTSFVIATVWILLMQSESWPEQSFVGEKAQLQQTALLSMTDHSGVKGRGIQMNRDSLYDDLREDPRFNRLQPVLLVPFFTPFLAPHLSPALMSPTMTN